MLIVYSGPFDEVEVPYLEDGRERYFVAKQGEGTECPGELAELLLRQDVWLRQGEFIAPASGSPRGGGKKVSLGESAAITGDGSGGALPPIESRDGEPLDDGGTPVSS